MAALLCNGFFMSDEQSKLTATGLAFLPVALLLALEAVLDAMGQAASNLPYFAAAVLFAQLLSLVIFLKGQICPGQRGRLIRANLLLGVYWLVWLGKGLLAQYTPTIACAVCGLCALYAVFAQPKDQGAARGFLLMAAAVLGLGLMGYLSVFFANSAVAFVTFSPLGALSLGALLGNLLLVVARNRVHGFIALLPLLTCALLALNVLALVGWIGFKNTDYSELQLTALSIYFAVHIVVALGLLFYTYKGWKLDYLALLILSFMLMSLPLWSLFI